MKATTDRRALVAALKAVAPAVAKSSHVAALYCVRIEATTAGLDLTCSDLDITAGALVTDLEGKPTNGVALIPHGTLLRLVEKMAGEHVTIDADTKTLEAVVTSGGTVATLRCKHPDDWPKLPPIEGDEVKLDADLVRQLAAILPFASVDLERPIIAAVSFADGWAVCTDSYRLGAFEGLPPELGPILVPAAHLRSIVSDEPATLTIGAKTVTFACGERTITVRATEGDYPNWKGLVPTSHPHHLTVEADALAGAIARVVALGLTPKAVTLTMEDRELVVSGHTVDVGAVEDRIPVTSISPSCPSVAFDPAYLASLLVGVEGDITLGITDQLKPITSKVDGRTLLLMPIRLGVK